MKNNKYKIFMIFSIAVLAIAIIVSTTYAYYVWTTEESNVTKIVAGVGAATVTFDGGSDVEANLRPVSDKSKGISKKIKVKADTTGLVFNLYLDMITLDTNLKHESFKYELYKGTTKVKEGNFSTTYLNSNTTTCTKNNTTHITLLTNESISTSNTEYTLYIWIDGANYTNPSTMMNKSFSFKLHADGEGAVLKVPTLADPIVELYNSSIKTPVQNNDNSITYQYDTTHSLMKDVEDNIRYYGASPNNYIYFNCATYPSTNCETWRIIGVFDGKVKIMRNSNIGSLAWDQDKNINSSKTTFDNDWSTASLKVLLNEKYYNGDTIGTVTYYSGGTGTTTASLNMANIGIKNDTTRNMIAEVTWNLGGWKGNSIYSDTIYEKERGTTVYSGRPTTWMGKIALAYPSDYGYAADLSKCTKKLGNYSDTTCTTNNWMKSILGTSSWLLTHTSNGSAGAWGVGSSGSVTTANGACNANGASPVLYLSSELVIESGDGSSSNPYRLSA
jgi:hypothetical protein